MLRKLILAAILLVLILGLSYIKTVRDHDTTSSERAEEVVPARDTSIDPGQIPPSEAVNPPAVEPPVTKPAVAPAITKAKPDTLSDALKQTLREYCQSVYEKLPPDLTDAERAAAAENIAKETANRFAVHEHKVQALWSPEDGAVQSAASPEPGPVEEAAGIDKTTADQVEIYFKDRTAELPSDLTNIERRIALDEIRKESAEKFELSLDEIYSIWQDRQLTSISVESLDAVGVEKLQPAVDDHYRRRIARYYRERFDSIPANLSEYDRTVAVAELKYQTAEHFSISLSELEKIWQEYEKSGS